MQSRILVINKNGKEVIPTLENILGLSLLNVFAAGQYKKSKYQILNTTYTLLAGPFEKDILTGEEQHFIYPLILGYILSVGVFLFLAGDPVIKWGIHRI